MPIETWVQLGSNNCQIRSQTEYCDAEGSGLVQDALDDDSLVTEEKDSVLTSSGTGFLRMALHARKEERVADRNWR